MYDEIFLQHSWLVSLNCKNVCVIGLAGHLIRIWSIGISIVVMISLSTSCTFVFCRIVVESCHYGRFLALVFLRAVLFHAVRLRSTSSVVWVFQKGHPFLLDGNLLVHSVVFIVIFFMAPRSCNPTDRNASFVSFVKN